MVFMLISILINTLFDLILITVNSSNDALLNIS